MESVNEVVARAIKAQLADPAKACVNSESSFVDYRLRCEGHMQIAKRYWSWVCRSPESNPHEFGEEVYALQMKLNGLDVGLPDWATKGT